MVIQVRLSSLRQVFEPKPGGSKEPSVAAAASESVPTMRTTRSRSRRKAARPKCSAGGDDQVKYERDIFRD